MLNTMGVEYCNRLQQFKIQSCLNNKHNQTVINLVYLGKSFQLSVLTKVICIAVSLGKHKTSELQQACFVFAWNKNLNIFKYMYLVFNLQWKPLFCSILPVQVFYQLLLSWQWVKLMCWMQIYNELEYAENKIQEISVTKIFSDTLFIF